MDALTLSLTLLALTCVASLANRVIRIPLPLLQIAVGVVAALPPLGLHVAFDPHTFLLLFIPPLLFADGWRFPQRELRALRWPLLGNAVGLVLLTTLIGGVALHWLIPGMTLPLAFAVAAVVSPTDPVAIAAITRRIVVPARLMHVLESEALLNDATGLVAFRLAVAAALTGQFSWPAAVGNFLLVAIGGLAAGWLLTQGFAWCSRRLTLHEADAPVQAVISALLPFAAYWLAEQVGVSGILAAVAAGVTANREGLLDRSDYAARMQSHSMWGMISYFFNGIVFVLLGTQLPPIVGPSPGGLDLTSGPAPFAVLGQIGALTLLLIAIRLVWVVGAIGVERAFGTRGEAAGWRIAVAGGLAGVRGAITLAGVLTLPLALADGRPFPGRDLAITLATGVILASLLIAAIGLPLVLRGMTPSAVGKEELRRARIVVAQAGAAAVAAMPGRFGEQAAALEALYQRRLDALRNPRAERASDGAWLDVHRHVLQAERDAVQRLRAERAIDDEAARQLIQEIDLAEAASAQRPQRLRVLLGGADQSANDEGAEGLAPRL